MLVTRAPRLGLGVVLLVLLPLGAWTAGCVEKEPADGSLYNFSGRFLPGTTEAQRRVLVERVMEAGGKVAPTDDLPPSRFGAYDLSFVACDALWAWAGTLAFVERTVACHPFRVESPPRARRRGGRDAARSPREASC